MKTPISEKGLQDILGPFAFYKVGFMRDEQAANVSPPRHRPMSNKTEFLMIPGILRRKSLSEYSFGLDI